MMGATHKVHVKLTLFQIPAWWIDLVSIRVSQLLLKMDFCLYSHIILFCYFFWQNECRKCDPASSDCFIVLPPQRHRTNILYRCNKQMRKDWQQTASDTLWDCDVNVILIIHHIMGVKEALGLFIWRCCQSNGVILLYYWHQLVCSVNSVDLNYSKCRSDIKNQFVSHCNAGDSTQPPSWSCKHRWQMFCQVVSILGSWKNNKSEYNIKW